MSPRSPYTLPLHDALPIYSPAVTQRCARAAESGPNASRATEPLYGTGTDRPAATTYGGTGTSSSAGASTLTSDRKSTRLNSSHLVISYAVFCLKKTNLRHI